jgi:hypothetical protein
MQCVVCNRMLRSNHFSFYFQILSLKCVEIPSAARGVSPSCSYFHEFRHSSFLFPDMCVCVFWIVHWKLPIVILWLIRHHLMKTIVLLCLTLLALNVHGEFVDIFVWRSQFGRCYVDSYGRFALRENIAQCIIDLFWGKNTRQEVEKSRIDLYDSYNVI